MPLSSDRLVLRNQNPLVPTTEIHHKPDPAGESDADALYLRQWATSGQGRAIAVHSDNADTVALRVQAAGPLVALYNASNAVKFEVSNTGAVTLYDALTLTSLATSGNATVGGTLGVTGAATLSSTLAVTGASTLTGNTSVGGTLGVTGAATLSSTLAVTGATTLTGGVTGATTITGDLTLQGTGKAYRFRRSGSALDLDATGVDLLISNFSGTNFDGTQRSYFRLSADAQNIQVAGKVEFVESLYGATRHVLDGAANTLGFHGATPVTQQTVSGSQGGNAALADLLTKLATLGLIADGTSA